MMMMMMMVILKVSFSEIYILLILYFSGEQIEKKDIGGERGDVYRVLIGEPEGKRPLVRPRFRWEDNIMIDPQEF